MLTASFTLTCSASKFSFSSSNLDRKETFSYCATQHCSMTTFCIFFMTSMSCLISSCARQRRASIALASLWSWAGSSPNSGASDGGGAVDTTRLWVCVIFFARVVVSERLRRARRGVRGGVQGGGAPRVGVRGQRPRKKKNFGPTYFRRFRADIFRRADIFPGRHISGTT
jgi:hypothetical protein